MLWHCWCSVELKIDIKMEFYGKSNKIIPYQIHTLFCSTTLHQIFHPQKGSWHSLRPWHSIDPDQMQQNVMLKVCTMFAYHSGVLKCKPENN